MLMIRNCYFRSRNCYFRSMPRVSANTRQKGHAKVTGFSLVELLVVVMVVLVIAAISIPNLVHARMQANEAAAVASMKTIETAQVMYAVLFPVSRPGLFAKYGAAGPQWHRLRQPEQDRRLHHHGRGADQRDKERLCLHSPGRWKTPVHKLYLDSRPGSDGLFRPLRIQREPDRRNHQRISHGERSGPVRHGQRQHLQLNGTPIH